MTPPIETPSALRAAMSPQDQNLIHIVATRMDLLHSDMQEIKSAQKEMAAAFAKLILIEERQANTASAQDRAFKTMEKLDMKIDANCAESRATYKKLESRVDTLEKAAPAYDRTSRWVDGAMYGAAGLLAMVVAKQLGWG